MNHNNDIRPNPDELLDSVRMEEERSKKGKLKIFFGMCAGVGKTYSMLEAAISEKLKGRNIIIGFVETHNRPETSRLTDGFDIIPRKIIEYRGTGFGEMDIDAIITRNPDIVIVDELAHSNVQGSRHAKRYMDVLELLDSGINVYSTLNVQHIESRSETVAQITGIIIRETIPDEIFENADEIELIDLTSEELLQRFADGKVYTFDRSREAIENFFRKGNITALREMALRIVADRVDRQLHDYMQKKKIKGPWKSGLHLLVAVDYNQKSARLLRWAKNLAYSMGASIQAVYIETLHKLSLQEQEQLNKNINLAKQLSIGFRIITHPDVVKALTAFAHKENVTHILIGKPRVRNKFSLLLLSNFIYRLIRYSGNIDVYILGSDKQTRDKFRKNISLPAFTSGLNKYLITTFIVIATSIFCYFLKNYAGYQVISFILLILVSVLALIFSTGPVLLAATLSAFIWNYFFIPPQFTIRIEKPADVLMFIMFFLIALLNGTLTSRIRAQEKKIRIREERTNALYKLTHELNTVSGITDVTMIAVKYIQKYFELQCSVFLRTETNKLSTNPVNQGADLFSENELSIAQWAFKHSSKAGRFTNTLPSTEFTFYPLSGINENMGVIAVKHSREFTQGEEQFWNACIAQVSGKFEREFLRNSAKKSYLYSESDKLYKTLFNSISHELRIPISTIIGSTDILLSQNHHEDTQKTLITEINTASIRLNQLIENLLDMSRLETGTISARLDWYDVHDLANSVTQYLQQELKPFNLIITIPDDMPLVKIDHGLMLHAIRNLVLNAIQNSQPGGLIRLKFFYDDDNLSIQVMDRGKGFNENDLPYIFNKFYRGSQATAGGTGLGLSIVKGFVEAHHGQVSARNRSNGGAIITIKLPVKSGNTVEETSE